MMTTFIVYLFAYLALYKLETNFAEAKQRGDVESDTYIHLRSKIELIKNDCGMLCDTTMIPQNIKDHDGDIIYAPFEKKVDCMALWNNSEIDRKTEFGEPIQVIPKYLYQYFSHYGRVNIQPYYFDEVNENIWKWNRTVTESGTNTW